MIIVRRKVERKPLTPRQKEVYDYIVECADVPPTWQEIGARFNCSEHSLWYYVQELCDKGYITRKRHITRGIRVL